MRKPADFLLSTLDTMIRWARGNSLWPLTFGLSCCAIEMMQTAASRYDLDRFGALFRPTPRQSDLLIVAGTVTQKMAPVLRHIYDQMPAPKWVIAMGACTCHGGCFSEVYAVVPNVSDILPVDIFVSGCPPTPDALAEAILQLHQKIQKGGDSL